MTDVSEPNSADEFENIDDEQCESAEPFVSTMESLRAFGYDLPSAIADLIDNSIFAGAKNIWVDFNWHGEHSTCIVTDDGRGMTEEVLKIAMRTGSQNPLESRDATDLGRFGSGLKTASFSQCRKLTVRSKSSTNRVEATRCWDLDFVAHKKKWLLLREAAKGSEKYFNKLNTLTHGTAVLWEKMDRIVKEYELDNEHHRSFFHNRIEEVEIYLSMVFHRFMEEKKRLKIFVNNNEVIPWDPFLKSEKATQHLPEEKLSVFQKEIHITPYILPHHSKLIPIEKHAKAGGPKGWNQQQGFYVYRNERLLVPGDWLGLPSCAKEEHYKLARIQLDLPNSMDQEWEIDVKKTKARPPDVLRKELKRIASATRGLASEIYRHRGKIVARKNSQNHMFVWKQLVRRGKYFYQVNREHPLVKLALKSDKDKTIERILKIVEETIPTSQIIITNSEQPDKLSGFEDIPEKEIIMLISEVYNAMVEQGISYSVAIERLYIMEPFSQFPHLVETFKEHNNNNND